MERSRIGSYQSNRSVSKFVSRKSGRAVTYTPRHNFFAWNIWSVVGEIRLGRRCLVKLMDVRAKRESRKLEAVSSSQSPSFARVIESLRIGFRCGASSSFDIGNFGNNLFSWSRFSVRHIFYRELVGNRLEPIGTGWNQLEIVRNG